MFDIARITAIYEGVRALFLSVYNQELPAYSTIAMETQSNSPREVYNWLGAIPTMREWISERIIDELSAFTFTVENRDWQGTIAIPRNAIEDDQIGLFRTLITSLAREARNHPTRLAYQLFEQNPICYDGQPLFSTLHQEGQSGTQSNIVTGTGTTIAALVNDLDTADARLASFKNDRGEPIVISGAPLHVTHVMVPPALKGAFETIARAEMIQNTTNRWAGRLDVIVNPYLSDSTDWYALDLSHDFKPVLVQIRRPATFQDLSSTAAEMELFHNKRFLIGVDARYAVAPAFWQTVVKVVNT